ncbi:MAG: TonB-dependent receptor [Motiliproteus sp.]|nr:TonB-dependent receptor [Motiliproteus sp.]MCW9054266.1 TonB-dependent receptor [Motiliproteus sp.]
MNIKSRLPLLAFAVSPIFVATSQAAEQVDKVVVTATKSAETIDQTLVPVSVISREDIDRSPAANIQELLATTPGLDISSNGGHGKTSSIFLRGTSNDHVLVLIDGIKFGSATSGTASIEQIPLNQVERIEIVRGPRSSLYGSEALGGVIQIFTRKGAQELTPTASFRAGNLGTREVNGSIRGGNESTQFGITVGHFETDGVDVLPGNNTDKDGYENNSLSASLRSELSDDFELSLTFMRTQSDNEFDNSTSSDRTSDGVQQLIGGKLIYQANDDLDISLQLAESRDESDDITDGVVTSVFDTRRRTADLQADYYLNDSNTLTLGAGFEEEEVSATTLFTDDSRDQHSLYGQWQSQWDRFDLLMGLRSDDYDAFGRHNTGSLNVGYSLGEGRKLLVSYGEGFHVPTFNDLFFPFTDFGFGFTYQGNPNLKPEESKSYEIGYQHYGVNGFWAVRVFRTEIDNLINLSGTMPTNLDSALIKGIEFELGTNVAEWDLKFSTTLLDATDENTGNVLLRRAERTAQLDLSRHYGVWTTGISFLAQSHRYNDTGNTQRLPGYGVTNLKVRYRVDKDWSLTASVNDLFDRDPTTAAAFGGNPLYNTPGRTFLFGVDYGI